MTGNPPSTQQWCLKMKILEGIVLESFAALIESEAHNLGYATRTYNLMDDNGNKLIVVYETEEELKKEEKER